MSSSRTCAEHTLQEIRFHCDACNVFVCDDCVSGEGKHSTCKKSKLNDHKNKQVLIESVAKITKKDIQQLKGHLTNQLMKPLLKFVQKREN